jgi:hypothetical protein
MTCDLMSDSSNSASAAAAAAEPLPWPYPWPLIFGGLLLCLLSAVCCLSAPSDPRLLLRCLRTQPPLLRSAAMRLPTIPTQCCNVCTPPQMELPAGPQPHGGAPEAAAAEEKVARAAAAEEDALAVAAAAAAAEAEQVRAAAEEKRRVATAAALRARPYNEKIAKAARLAGTERPCIGLCAQVVQRPPTTPEGLIDDDISGCRLVPFDVTAYASYIGAPMQQWPGLAAVCKLALVERLPPCCECCQRNAPLRSALLRSLHPMLTRSSAVGGSWRGAWVLCIHTGREVDPRASKVPGYHGGEEGRAAYAALGGSKLVFFNRETGRARVQHPRDAFYRQLILLLLRENDNPFTREVMHFNVVGNADSKKDFFFDFRSNKTVSLDEALAEAEESTVSYAGGVTRASTLSDDLTTRRLLRELSPRVEAQAARTIWGAFRHWKVTPSRTEAACSRFPCASQRPGLTAPQCGAPGGRDLALPRQDRGDPAQRAAPQAAAGRAAVPAAAQACGVVGGRSFFLFFGWWWWWWWWCVCVVEPCVVGAVLGGCVPTWRVKLSYERKEVAAGAGMRRFGAGPILRAGGSWRSLGPSSPRRCAWPWPGGW